MGEGDQPDEDWPMTPDQAAVLLGQPVSLVLAAVERGELNAARVGEHRRLSAAQVRRVSTGGLL